LGRMSDLEELLEGVSKAAAALGSATSSGKLITIRAHDDVDGICSGTIAFLTVRALGGSAHLSFSGHLYEDELAKLLSGRPEFLMLCDMGSDLVPVLRKSRVPYLVLDHHPSEERDDQLVNPWAFGINGAREISASGCAYLVSRALDGDSTALALIAICGAYGDMQSIEGPNERILTEAESTGLVKRRKEIRLIGRVDRPIEYSIRYSTSPFIRDLAGDPDAVREFLKEVGLATDPTLTISQLDADKERMLISGIVERMVRANASTFEAEKLFGSTLRLPRAAVPTIEDLVDYLESCAALKRYSVGFSLLVGEPGALAEAEGCRLCYKEKIFEGVRLFKRAVRMPNIEYLVLEGWTEYSGKLSTIYANAGFARQDAPVFALNAEGQHIKVSARANPQLVKKGLDLGRALSRVAERFGGVGGGHDVAAGARVPRGCQEEFLRALDKEIGMQLAGREEAVDG